MNLIEFQQEFGTEEQCIEWLIKRRWGDDKKPICPHCGSIHVSTHKTRNIYTCLDCKKQFSVRIGTIFEDSRIPLFKWFVAIYLFTSLKKGISSIQLAKYISVTQKTAWFILHRIREAMNNNENDQLKNIVEMDETYVGGKAENMHLNKRIKAKSVYEKATVFGMVERDGVVKAKPVKNAGVKSLLPEIYNNIEENSLLITDEYKTYKSIGYSYVHRTVNHSEGQYVKDGTYKGNTIRLYTNTIEGFCRN